jgi:hypothetical protein
LIASQKTKTRCELVDSSLQSEGSLIFIFFIKQNTEGAEHRANTPPGGNSQHTPHRLAGFITQSITKLNQSITNFQSSMTNHLRKFLQIFTPKFQPVIYKCNFKLLNIKFTKLQQV